MQANDAEKKEKLLSEDNVTCQLTTENGTTQ